MGKKKLSWKLDKLLGYNRLASYHPIQKVILGQVKTIDHQNKGGKFLKKVWCCEVNNENWPPYIVSS